VHYVRFPLGRAGAEALARGERARIEVRHGDYRAEAVLPAETVEELRRDLDGAPEGT
jgi:hypothetical protein